MSNYIALDIGRKHTGVAFADGRVGVALPLDTLHHEHAEELIASLLPLIKTRGVTDVVVGMPYLMNGSEGEEAAWVRGIVELLGNAFPLCTICTLDERETSRMFYGAHAQDRHAEAAVRILATFLERSR